MESSDAISHQVALRFGNNCILGAIFLLLCSFGTAVQGIHLEFPGKMSTAYLLEQSSAPEGVDIAWSSAPTCKWITVEVHTQSRPVQLGDNEGWQTTMHSARTYQCDVNSHPPSDIAMVLRHSSGDYRPIIVYVRARIVNTTYTAGQTKDTSAQANSTLDLSTGAEYVTFQPVQSSRQFRYVLHVHHLASPSQGHMMQFISQISSQQFEGRDVVNKIGSAGRYGFRYLPDLYHGTMYQVVAIDQDSGERLYYTPIAIYACKLDSTALTNDRCSGVLPLDTGASGVLQLSSVFQEYVFNVPLSAAMGTSNSSWYYALLQLHTLHAELTLSRSPLGTNQSMPGHAAAAGRSPAILVSARSEMVTEQVAANVSHSPTFTVNAAVPFQLRLTLSWQSLEPGLCSSGKGLNPIVTSSSQSTSTQSAVWISAPRPGNPGSPLSSCVTTPVLYEFFMLTIPSGSSVEEILSVISKMQTVESVRLSSKLIASNQSSAGVALRPFLQRVAVDTGFIFNVLVTDVTGHVTVAYAPETYFSCFRQVNSILQLSFPCQLQLPVNRVQSLKLYDGQASPLLVRTPTSPAFVGGFVVVQSHAQAHRLTAAVSVYPLMTGSHKGSTGSPAAAPSLSSLTARSTGVVVGDVAFETNAYVKTYSVVNIPATVMAVSYPKTYAIPGGCCPGCAVSAAAARRNNGSLANATIGLSFDAHTTYVTFYDAAVLVGPIYDTLVCAYAAASKVTVDYDIYELTLGKNTSAAVFQRGLAQMYTVDGILNSSAVLVSSALTSDRLLHTYTTPTKPGVGRIFAVIAKLMSASGSLIGQSAYIPATTYDCSYVSGKMNDASAVCMVVLQPGQQYRAAVSRLSNASFVLNDWQASASKWTFAVINIHTQKFPVLASTTLAAGADTSSVKTNIGLAPILNPNGGNEQTYVYVGPSLSASDLLASPNASVDMVMQAIPYGPSVPIPGGCCLSCSLDVDPTLSIAFVGFRTDIDFYQANVGFPTSTGVPSYCDTSAGHNDISRLKYSYYKYALDFGKYDQETMFSGLQKMSTVSSVKKHGILVGDGGFKYNGKHKLSTLSRPGRGVIYNVIVEDPLNKSLVAAYSPFVTYSCNFLSGDQNCNHLDSLPIQIGVTLLGVIGLFLCFAGHNFYRTELFCIGGFLPLIVGFATLNVMTDLSDAWLVVLSLCIAIVFGALLLFTWYRLSFQHIFHLIVGLVCGVLTASILFYTPFGNISLWHMSVLNYWSAFLVTTLIIPVLALLMPLYMNIFATSLLGSFLAIMGVSQYLGSGLLMVMLDVILHVTNASISDSIYSESTLSETDIILCSAWGVLLIAGYIVQLLVHRKSGRPNFPESPSSKTSGSPASRRRNVRRREDPFPDSPPLTPTSEQERAVRGGGGGGGRTRNMQPVGTNDRGWRARGRQNQQQQQQQRPTRQQRQRAAEPDDRQPLLGNRSTDAPPGYGSVGCIQSTPTHTIQQQQQQDGGGSSVASDGRPTVRAVGEEQQSFGNRSAAQRDPMIDPLLVGVPPLIMSSRK